MCYVRFGEDCVSQEGRIGIVGVGVCVFFGGWQQCCSIALVHISPSLSLRLHVSLSFLNCFSNLPLFVVWSRLMHAHSWPHVIPIDHCYVQWIDSVTTTKRRKHVNLHSKSYPCGRALRESGSTPGCKGVIPFLLISADLHKALCGSWPSGGSFLGECLESLCWWDFKGNTRRGSHPFLHYIKLCANLRGHTWWPSPLQRPPHLFFPSCRLNAM